jgi:hypothetical protein
MKKSSGVWSLISAMMSAVTFCMLSGIAGDKIRRYNQNKVHGVHETTFVFTGDYEIRGEVKHDKLWYVGYCSATTSRHGDCEYACYKSKQEADSYEYTESYCGNNGTSIELYGYISTELQECQTDDFNDFHIRIWIYVCVVVSVLTVLSIIVAGGHAFNLVYRNDMANTYKDETELIGIGSRLV